jgi:lysophospholipase L1-like esterase
VSRNFDDEDDQTMEGIYARTLFEDPTSTWSFETFKPDVVFIALGANDFAQSNGRPAPDLDVFRERYAALVATVRARNPGAQIVCAVSSSINDEDPEGYDSFTNITEALKAVVDERHGAGDPKVHYYEMPRADVSEGEGAPDMTGCDGHPNARLHRKIADDAVPMLKGILGW